MGAAEDDAIDAEIQDLGQIVLHRLSGYIMVEQPLLHQRHKERTSLCVNFYRRIECVDRTDIGTGSDRCRCADDAHLPVRGPLDRSPCSGQHHPYHRDLFDLRGDEVERNRGDRVARHDEQLDIHLHQQSGILDAEGPDRLF